MRSLASNGYLVVLEATLSHAPVGATRVTGPPGSAEKPVFLASVGFGSHVAEPPMRVV